LFSFVYEVVLVWTSNRYRSTSPSYALLLPLAFVVAVAEVILAHVAHVVGKEFDCRERWIRVDGPVCGLVYASCLYTTREDMCERSIQIICLFLFLCLVRGLEGSDWWC